jgi:hypothetical protein
MTDIKYEIERRVKQVVMKLSKDKKAIRDISLLSFALMKLDLKEQRAWLKFNKLCEDNYRWLGKLEGIKIGEQNIIKLIKDRIQAIKDKGCEEGDYSELVFILSKLEILK